jgi:uncharacterized protein YbjT (DUF2867 family)
MPKSSSKRGLVLVTGGSGYVAGYCIAELLNNGWCVRSTVRSSRSDQFVIVLRVRRGDRRRDMQNVLRTTGRLAPARVRVEIGFDELRFPMRLSRCC